MKNIEEIQEQLTPIDVWVTPNVAIYRQLTMWDATRKEFHFVPSTVVGYVIVVAHNSLQNCFIKRGFCLYRPAGLALSWYCDKPVSFRTLSVSDAALWRFKRGERWQDVVSSARY